MVLPDPNKYQGILGGNYNQNNQNNNNSWVGIEHKMTEVERGNNSRNIWNPFSNISNERYYQRSRSIFIPPRSNRMQSSGSMVPCSCAALFFVNPRWMQDACENSVAYVG